MSTAKVAFEVQSAPSIGNNLKGQPARTRFLSRQATCAIIFILTDLSAILLALTLAIFMRAHLVPRMDARFRSSTYPLSHYTAFGWLLLLPIAFLAVEGLYTRRRSLWNEVGHLIKAIGFSLIAMLAALALTELTPFVSRTTILLTAANLLVLLPLGRYWTKRILRILGPWRKQILVLGSTDMALLAMRGLASDPFLGYEVAGVVDDDFSKMGQCVGVYHGARIHVVGPLSEAREQMERTNSRDLLIALPNLAKEKLLALVHELQPHCDSIYVVPDLWGLPMMNLQVDGFLRERVMMLKLSNELAKPWNCWLKRGFDLFLGCVISLLIIPLCAVLAVLIKLDSPGPVLFDQERLGYRGGSFRCFKFRTMHVNSNEILAQHLECNPLAAAEWQKFAKLRYLDPRLTRLGRFLRRWSLDELPQLINVLKGEMSLVGPRPYLLQERARIGVDLHTIVSARPGMTGFWQVSGRNHLTLEERVQIEAWYVRNWTVWLDCIVLSKTFGAVLFSPNRSPASDVPAIDQREFLLDRE